MRGRKPKPTALKVLEGVRAGRIPDSEPAPIRGIPEPPEWLGLVARDHWAELAPQLDGSGVLTLADGPALAMLCDAFERLRLSTAITERDAARREYIRLLCEFGLTPASRAGLKLPPPAPRDALADFLEPS